MNRRDSQRLTRVGARKTRSIWKERTRQHVKNIVRRFGYEVHAAGAIGRSTAGFYGLVKSAGWTPATVIDVGVAYGTGELYAAFPSAKYLLVEPVLEWWDHIFRTCRRLDFVAARVAAAAFDGTLELHVYEDLEASSVPGDSARAGEKVELRTVPARRVDSLCEECEMSGPFLLKVDVQGHELGVLAGATGILDDVDVIVAEVGVGAGGDDVSNIASLACWAADRGFRVVDICDGVAETPTMLLLQVDVALVRCGSAVDKSLSRLGEVGCRRLPWGRT